MLIASQVRTPDRSSVNGRPGHYRYNMLPYYEKPSQHYSLVCTHQRHSVSFHMRRPFNLDTE